MRKDGYPISFFFIFGQTKSIIKMNDIEKEFELVKDAIKEIDKEL